MGVHPDAPAMRLDNRLGKIQPQTGSFGFADSFIRAIEAVKYIGDVAGIDTRTLVTDTDDNLFRADLASDADFAAGGIFNGIGNEIGYDLGDAVFVCQNDGESFREIHHDGVILSLGPEAFG